MTTTATASASPVTQPLVTRAITDRGQETNRDARKSVVNIVTQIKRADYEGDRAALRRLYEELAPFVDDKTIGARVRYWRGFALWRRAFNGTTASANEIEDDLTLAVGEFEKAVARDSRFIDAKIAAASCWQNISALYYVQRDMGRAKELMEIVSITQGRRSCGTR